PDVLCLQTLGSSLHVELDGLAFCETAEAIRDDRAVVAEHVLATFLFDESKSLRVVEPLHGTSCHFSHPNDQAATPLNNARTNMHRQADHYPTWGRKSSRNSLMNPKVYFSDCPGWSDHSHARRRKAELRPGAAREEKAAGQVVGLSAAGRRCGVVDPVDVEG